MLNDRWLRIGLPFFFLTAVAALGMSLYGVVSSNQPVAVIDLERVASELGKDKQIEAAVKERTSLLNAQLVAVRKKLEEQLAKTEEAAKANPESAEAKRLATARQQAHRQMADANQRAAQNVNALRIGLVNEFREQSKTLASQVAHKQGASLVVAKNEAFLLDYQAAVDITDQVIQCSVVE